MSFFKYLSSVIRKKNYRKKHDEVEALEESERTQARIDRLTELTNDHQSRRGLLADDPHQYDPTRNPGNYADIYTGVYSSTFSFNPASLGSLVNDEVVNVTSSSEESGTVNMQIQYNYDEGNDKFKRKITAIENNKVREPKQESTKKTKFDQILE